MPKVRVGDVRAADMGHARVIQFHRIGRGQSADHYLL